ncbi:BTAD domain-containing putative transcriptional regulator [Streptomyces avermitilis]|uniref:BTAD domain-containing putative transcriptional regulator n=1 Tax=Streptomyces avermitilis TaxID=33903 RepID=UPI003F4D25EE
MCPPPSRRGRAAAAGGVQDERRIEADLALARHQRLVPELTGPVGEFLVRERLRAQLMTALYRCGWSRCPSWR